MPKMYPVPALKPFHLKVIRPTDAFRDIRSNARVGQCGLQNSDVKKTKT